MSHAASESPLSVDNNPWDGQPERLLQAGFATIGVGLLGISSCLIAKTPDWINFIWVALIAFGAFAMVYGGNILRDRVEILLNAARSSEQQERTSANTASRRWVPLGQPENR